MIVFDMDSTLIDAETIDEFARAAGIIGKVEEITKRERCGNLDFEQTLAEWVRIIRELPLEKIPYAVHKIHIMPVVAELILYFKSRGYKDTMIFGGFTISTTEAGKALNNNLVVTNELLVEDGCLKSKVVGSVTQSNPRGAFEGLILFSRVRPERGVVVGEGLGRVVRYGDVEAQEGAFGVEAYRVGYGYVVPLLPVEFLSQFVNLLLGFDLLFLLLLPFSSHREECL